MSIQSYLNNVLSLIELNPAAKKDLQQELDDHASDKISYYQTKGFSQSEAEEKTKSDFGNPRVFAKKINDAHFPFRYSLLAWLSTLSIVFSLVIGFSLLAHQQIFPYGWVLITTGSSTLLFYFIRQPSRSANNRLILIFLLIWLNLLYMYGLLLMDGFQHVTCLYFISLAYLLVLMGISLSQILVGAIYQPIDLNLNKQKKQERTFSVLTNILTGIIVGAISLVYIVGLFIFGPRPVFEIGDLIPLSLIIWILLVVGEVKWNQYSSAFRVSKILLAMLLLGYFVMNQVAYF